MEDVDKFIVSISSKKQLEDYYYKGKLTYKLNFVHRSKFVAYFDRFQESIQQYHKDYFTYETPLFVANQHGYILTLNANLKNVDFFRVFDPFQAFQELSMYLGGLAVPQKTIPVLDDLTMRDIKGFDKFSFRKDKSTK